MGVRLRADHRAPPQVWGGSSACRLQPQATAIEANSWVSACVPTTARLPSAGRQRGACRLQPQAAAGGADTWVSACLATTARLPECGAAAGLAGCSRRPPP